MCAAVRQANGATLEPMVIRGRTLAAIILVVCIAFVIISSVAFRPHSSALGDPAPQSSQAPVAPVTGTPVMPGAIGSTSAVALLATLPVRPALTMAGYNRTGDFGAAWLDEDHNGCDTRDDVLTRDLTSTTRSGACKVLTRVLISPYTAATIHFVRGVKTSALVQIDHIVALGDAWETGAQSLPQARRLQLANDPLELLAVDGRSNDEKSDKDASQWLPPDASFDCVYVARQISVKVAYSLWVTPTEHDAMVTVLSKCGAISGVASEFAG
jgi:hypothetical protein